MFFYDFELVNQSETFSFSFSFELVTQKYKNKRLNLWVSNSKFDLAFYEVESVTQKKNFYKNFRVSNLKCDVILCNSVS